MRSKLSLLVFLGIFGLPFSPAVAEEQPPQQQVTVAEPEPVLLEKDEYLGKKPEISGRFNLLQAPATVTVLLDGDDITQMVAIDGTGFRFVPPFPLRSGEHSISVSVIDSDGNQINRDMRFTTRHTPFLEEAYSSNLLSADFQTPLITKRQDSIPDTRVDMNLQSENKVKKGNFEASLSTSLRYFDQNHPLPAYASSDNSPLVKGISLMNYLFTARQQYSEGALQAELGNALSINETSNTVMNLQRRGGRLSASYGGLTVSGFNVKGENLFSFHGGTGLSGNLDSNIAGISGTYSLPGQQLAIKTVYARGGEPGNSIGIAGVGGGREGDVIGVNLLTDFWANKFRTDFEADHTRFDNDTSDDIGKKGANAWRFKGGGALGTFSYDAGYEYFGRDYASIGNLMQQRDRETYTVRGGNVWGSHMLNAGFSRSHDNVSNDPLFTRTASNITSLDYSFSGIPALPMGVSYQNSIQKTSHAESGIMADMVTDAVAARLNYSLNPFMFNLSGGWSRINDRTETNGDSSTFNIAVSPGLMMPQLVITPSFAFNRTIQNQTSIHTDTYTTNLDLRSKFFNERLAFDVAGTYSLMKANDEWTDMTNINVQGRLAYSLAEYFTQYLKPSVALRGIYQKTINRVNHAADTESGAILLVLSAAVPFLF